MAFLKLARPSKQPARGTPTVKSGKAGNRAAPKGASRILIASDDAVERAAWRAVLSEDSYTISELDDGHAAWTIIQEGKADLVVAAVTLYTMDALELLRAAQDIRRSPPIVVVSRGHSEIDQIYLRSATLLGAAATFMQPFEASEFFSGIRAVLQFRQTLSGNC
jgi:DNA-binding response OmpR family regulator